MFLTTIIRLEKYRFNYGRKWNKKRMEESSIKLPSTAGGKPDWRFMEDFIKGLPYSSGLK
jgi:type I restriction enzyme M protein